VNTHTISPQWPAVAGVRALFTLRHNGVSPAPYESFNLGTHVGDELDNVRQNRRQLCKAHGLPREPVWLEQLHGTRVVDADQALLMDAAPPPPRGDAAISRQAGTVLAVLVADCLPVLFAACDGSAVAVAHAGWRGLAGGVLEATVAALAGHGPLQAWLGPAISSLHFEVGPEVRECFTAHDPGAAAAFSANSRGRWQCDLRALAQARLAASGVRSVHGDTGCTYAEPQRFYSYRRDGTTGRMAALIWLQAAQC
jgi:polyphenol oxidase